MTIPCKISVIWKQGENFCCLQYISGQIELETIQKLSLS